MSPGFYVSFELRRVAAVLLVAGIAGLWKMEVLVLRLLINGTLS